jgi:hypothetical protein
MTLSAAALKSAIQGVGNQATIAAAAAAWAGAVGAYAAGVVPASTTVAAAQAALQTALASAFAQRPSAAGAMETAFAAFALTISGGMAGAGFTATPPAGEVGFADLFDPPTDDAEQAAEDLANAIHAWMTTGSAALIAPPNTVSPWA